MLLQILVEKSLIEAIGLEWAGLDGGTCPVPAAASSHIAARNHALLTQRMESDLAASRSSYSLMSPGDSSGFVRHFDSSCAAQKGEDAVTKSQLHL